MPHSVLSETTMADLSVVCAENNIIGQVCEASSLHRPTTDQNGSLTCCGTEFRDHRHCCLLSLSTFVKAHVIAGVLFSRVLLMFRYLLMGFTLSHGAVGGGVVETT